MIPDKANSPGWQGVFSWQRNHTNLMDWMNHYAGVNAFALSPALFAAAANTP